MNKLLDSAKRITGIVSKLCNIECNTVDAATQCEMATDFCYVCAKEQLRLMGEQKCKGITAVCVYHADRWGGKYEFLCPLGCAFVSTSMSSGAEVECGVLIGPFLLIEKDDFSDNDVRIFFKGKARIDDAVKTMLPVIEPETVHYLTDMVFMLSSYLSEREILDQRVMEVSGAYQSAIYDSLIKIKSDEQEQTYPIEIEKMLQMYIKHGDRLGAQTALNDILGYIYFSSNGNFGVMKARVTELIVLLSRAAIEGGASVSEVFGLNTDYLSQISALMDIEQLNTWLYHALIRFTNTVFMVDDTKHSEIIKRVMEYIRKHLSEKITLNDVSNYVNFSVSYLSRIFKEETGENISTYINRMRVEQAKTLLLNPKYSLVEVTGMLGFEDQSYFNKVFKKMCGITPGKYREKHGKSI